MKLQIETVAVSSGLSIGFGIGVPVNDSTKRVLFAGDWRAMTGLGEAMAASDEPIEVEVPDFAIIAIAELPDL